MGDRETPDRYAWRFRQAQRPCRPCQHWPDHPVLPYSRLQPRSRHRGSPSLSVQVPGRQKIIVSKNWGFTPLRREEYVTKRQEGKVRVDGAYVQFLSSKGPLEYNMRRFPDAFETEA